MTNWQLLVLILTDWRFWFAAVALTAWGWFQVWIWS